jgi:predicted TPR repeat methyltransferase
VDEAAASYHRALERKPDYPEALNNLGIALMDQSQTPEAMAAFQKALDLKPDFPEACNNFGLALLAQKKFSEAVGYGRRALELKPNYPEAHKTLGDALREQGKLEEAAKAYRRAVDAKPDYAEAYNNLGVILANQGKPDEAIAYYRQALELNPDYVEVHNNLGIALKMQGNVEGAIASYRRALDLSPKYPEAYNNLANALLDQGKSEAAEASWRRAIELKPDCTDAYGNLGMMLYEKGRIGEAAAILQRWLEFDPENPIARHMAASFTGENVPSRAGDDYVRYSFDHFARTFDQKLQNLDYRAPELVAAVIAKALGEPGATLEVVDAGCGTGWCGPLLRPYARRLIGVDLSPAMLEKARAREVYDELIEAELTAYFLEAPNASWDLIVSADTLVYFGDLQPISAAAAHVLRPDGLLIFTLEKAGDDVAAGQGFFLQPHGRYCHTEAYVRCALQKAGLSIREITPGILRMELGKPVQGMVVSASRTGFQPVI